MNLRKAVAYGTAAAATAATLGGAVLIGDRMQYAMKTRPLERQVYQLKQEMEETSQRLDKYNVRLADGRAAKLNPDMSLTISGISGGDNRIDVCPQEFRNLKKR